MWKAFQRYRTLDPEARALFRRAAFLLPWVAVSLRLRGFQKTQAALVDKISSTPSLSPRNQNSQEIVQKTVRVVRAAAHYGILHPTCLVESLALWYLLQMQNILATLRIGVRKTSDKVEAHAWVEYSGTALNQPEDEHQHYAPLDKAFSDLPREKL
jgi:hypothetical protein